ncbi:alpha/beta hydrolase [Kribbella sp. ALI-6-A]|uniref:alpha/beta fold hydrolase n=1 Tax=Kribbella sp. ALI-6-A TaxID=1933817 RepID=UPI00097C7B35|nr:alpha/beta hydrolase [Kribbella sp. ALI-6-A]ONI75712.1 alpha/beta hydrolase [Kribbella sp. ALI-6-A]
MNERPMVLLAHGAFAESALWSEVLTRLRARSIEAVAAATPLRGLAMDAAYVRDVIAGLGRPVVLVGHSYGGAVITEAATHAHDVRGLVYVAAFAPDHGESAFELMGRSPGSMLAHALVASPVSTGGVELTIAHDAFHRVVAADVAADRAALLSVTQRPVAQAALMAALPAGVPAWKRLPSWFAFGDEDLVIPVAVHRAMARRAGARGIREVAGASHSLAVSAPDVVTAAIADALRG